MSSILIIFLISFGFADAKTENVSSFKILEEQVKFYNYPNMRLTISQSCDLAEKGKFCPSLDFLKTLSLKKYDLEKEGEQNPASLLCKKTLNGNVYIGIDKDNNENSFCRLKDNSYVDGGTLTYYANKNDGITQKPRNKAKYKK